MSELSAIKAYIRQKMKEQSTTQAELASHLDMSLSGLKKVLAREDISFELLASILNALGSSLSQFYASQSAQSVHEELKINPQIEELLETDDNAFRVFWLCGVERRPLSDVSSLLSLPTQQLYGVLRKLDDAGLLRWKAGDSVTSGLSPLLKLAQGSPVRRRVEREILGVSPDSSTATRLRGDWQWRVWRLSDSQAKLFLREIDELLLRISRGSASAINSYDSRELKTFRFLYHAEFFSPFSVNG
jgi:transcriptional regulator with XRE-family HTH domain